MTLRTKEYFHVPAMANKTVIKKVRKQFHEIQSFISDHYINR